MSTPEPWLATVTTNGQKANLSWCQASTTRFLLLSDSCRYAHVGHPPCWQDGSIVYNRCWASPVQSSLGLSPIRVMIMFYCLKFETLQTWWASHHIYIPQEQDGPVIPPDNRFHTLHTEPITRLLLKLKLKLICNRRSVGQSVLVSGAHLGPVTDFSFSLKFPLDSCVFVIL
jgi:hypothetical protein